MRWFVFPIVLVATSWTWPAAADEGLRIAVFEADVTPPIGAPLCDALVPPAKEIVDPLSARGVVLLGARGGPIVLCAVDWVGIGNESHDAWRAALAEAAGTDAARVAVHCLHQHDAPGSDDGAEAIARPFKHGGKLFDVAFAGKAVERTAAAVKASLAHARPVTHIGLGRAKAERVASNRRILGPLGKVRIVRYSSTKNPDAIQAPEGVIDPYVRIVSFWNGDEPLAVLSYYATHPQSHYGQGGVSADFVGMARAQREKQLQGPAHVHFNGAGGNVAAGKYNDGTPQRRPELAGRLAAGMKAAWEATKKTPITPEAVEWRIEPVSLPLTPRLDDVSDEAPLIETLKQSEPEMRALSRAARDLAFARRIRAGHRIDLTCLRLGDAYILHMPGELFVEYQLEAQKVRPGDFVAMAAYGDYGPGYIGTEVAYEQGGYETGIVSRTSPKVERVLVDAMKKLLK